MMISGPFKARLPTVRVVAYHPSYFLLDCEIVFELELALELALATERATEFDQSALSFMPALVSALVVPQLFLRDPAAALEPEIGSFIALASGFGP